MRLSDLFALPEFSEFSLIAGGQNGGRVITSVNVIDSPDSYQSTYSATCTLRAESFC